MICIVLLSFMVLAYYVAYVSGRFGVPTSLSATYYLLEKKGWIFQLALFLSAVMLLPAMMEATSRDFKLLEFLTCSGVLFVSVAPAFKIRIEGKVHAVAAIISGVSGVLWCVLNGGIGESVVMLFAAFVGYARCGNPIFWAEMACFASVYLTVIKIFLIVGL